jgi:hypothetical protein
MSERVGEQDNVRAVLHMEELRGEVVLTSLTLHTACIRRSEVMGACVCVGISLQHGPAALAPAIKGGLIQLANF